MWCKRYLHLVILYDQEVLSNLLKQLTVMNLTKKDKTLWTYSSTHVYDKVHLNYFEPFKAFDYIVSERQTEKLCFLYLVWFRPACNLYYYTVFERQIEINWLNWPWIRPACNLYLVQSLWKSNWDKLFLIDPGLSLQLPCTLCRFPELQMEKSCP